MARVDYTISSKTNLFGRFSTDHYSTTSPNGVQVDSAGQLNSQFDQLTAPNAVIDLQHTFPPPSSRTPVSDSIATNFMRVATKCFRSAAL